MKECVSTTITPLACVRCETLTRGFAGKVNANANEFTIKFHITTLLTMMESSGSIIFWMAALIDCGIIKLIDLLLLAEREYYKNLP